MKKEKGAVLIVEATIVFPIVFFVVFLIIFYGNVFYQRSRIDNYVSSYAQWGAQQCADPLFDGVVSRGSVSRSTGDMDIKPYRNFGSMNDIELKVISKIGEKSKGAGFFKGMQPKNMNVTAKYTNHIIYSNFEVEAKYNIEFPITLLGTKIKLSTMSAYEEVPVSDPAEFIHNINMAKDFIQSNKKIQDAIKKVKDFFD